MHSFLRYYLLTVIFTFSVICSSFNTSTECLTSYLSLRKAYKGFNFGWGLRTHFAHHLWVLFSAYGARTWFAHCIWMDRRGALTNMVVAPFEIKFGLILFLHILLKSVTCRNLGKGRSDHVCWHILFLLMSPGNCSEGIHSPWTVQMSDFGK